MSKALEKLIAMVNVRHGDFETPGYSMCEGEEGGNGGVVGTKAMLGG